MTFIKICGVTQLEDALAAAALGASAVGFVFWPRSPRYIDPTAARAIVDRLPPLVTPVGVFVDQPAAEVEQVATRARLGAVQLHGRETASYCCDLRRPVIKAFGVDATFDEEALTAYPAGITVLLDARDEERKGGTGQPIDLRVAARVAARRRLVLAGGLQPETVGEAIARVRPFGIDVSSGVECAPGVKDHDRLRLLFDAVRQTDATLARGGQQKTRDQEPPKDQKPRTKDD
jgi:phosphoribosylanthranilate isomerase